MSMEQYKCSFFASIDLLSKFHPHVAEDLVKKLWDIIVLVKAGVKGCYTLVYICVCAVVYAICVCTPVPKDYTDLLRLYTHVPGATDVQL